jgi:hypothetical protein
MPSGATSTTAGICRIEKPCAGNVIELGRLQNAVDPPGLDPLRHCVPYKDDAEAYVLALHARIGEEKRQASASCP